jgi:circadian clock protein KaiC
VFADIVTAIDEHRPRVMVLDPLSALLKQGGATGGKNSADIAFRIVQQCKLRGITLCLTSLVDQTDPTAESTELHVSTLADTWIHLSYLIRSGERNRAITVVKSRGSGHSNQVRELILSSGGITLENVYSEEGEVLMGTMRSQHEARAAEARHMAAEDLSRQRAQKVSAVDQLTARIDEQRLELTRLKRELATDASSVQSTSARNLRDRNISSVMRSADKPKSGGTRK